MLKLVTYGFSVVPAAVWPQADTLRQPGQALWGIDWLMHYGMAAWNCWAAASPEVRTAVRLAAVLAVVGILVALGFLGRCSWRKWVQYHIGELDRKCRSFEDLVSRDRLCLRRNDDLKWHRLFAESREYGLALPEFAALIRPGLDPETASLLIRETAYWGSDEQMRSLVAYFLAPDPEYRRAAFEAMAIRCFAEAQDQMMDSYADQPEEIRRIVLETVLALGTSSRRVVAFFRDAYLTSLSRLTRRSALRCLRLSGPEGEAAFEELKRNAPEIELPLFR